MRSLPSIILGLALVGCASTPKGPSLSLQIEEIKPRYIQEESFKRMSEFWSGAEKQGNRIILRTDPDVRDGFYFTLVLDGRVRALPRGTVITGEFLTPFSTELQTHEFRIPNRKLPKTKEIFLGLTGADWPEEGGVATAWRFTIRDANGNQLAQRQSFLWSL